MNVSLRKSIVIGAIAAAALAVASPASAAVIDPERNSTAITGWWWYYGQTEAQLNSIATTNGARIVDIEVESTSPYLFTAAFVKNTGTYARTWYWYYGLTSAGVAAEDLVAERHASSTSSATRSEASGASPSRW